MTVSAGKLIAAPLRLDAARAAATAAALRPCSIRLALGRAVLLSEVCTFGTQWLQALHLGSSLTRLNRLKTIHNGYSD